MKPHWIKWYPVQWLHSTARDEMKAEERGTFQDFVCLASPSISQIPGQFKFVDVAALARKLNTPVDVIKRTIEICTRRDRIRITENTEGFVCRIIKYHIYQPSLADGDVNENGGQADLKLTGEPDEKKLLTLNALRGRGRGRSEEEEEDLRSRPSRAKKPARRIQLILDEEPKRWEGIMPEEKMLWAKTYPGVDIEAALQEMITYWDAQPKSHRKLDWKRAIVNRLKWLQDHGGFRRAQGPPASRRKAVVDAWAGKDKK